MKKYACILLIALCLLSGCSLRPRKVLSKKHMQEVLYDLYRTDGILQTAGYSYGQDEEVAKYYQEVLMRHGITQAQFDSSLVWYTAHPKQFKTIYPPVVERLKADKEEATANNSRHFDSLKEKHIVKKEHTLNTDSILRIVSSGYAYQWNSNDFDNTLHTDSNFIYLVLPDYQDSINVDSANLSVSTDTITSPIETIRNNSLKKSSIIPTTPTKKENQAQLHRLTP